MSFLNELRKQRERLKETETVVTNARGQRFIEKKNESDTFVKSECVSNSYGFVVDTKPDDVPISITDYIFIGSQDCAEKTVLDAYNIHNVLSLGIEIDLEGYNQMYVQCLDLPETDIKPVLCRCLSFLSEIVKMKQNVLIHCNAGVSRTSMVAIGYLMLCEKMSYIDAYNLVKYKRAAIQPNSGFVKQLQTLNENDVEF